jgi:Na+-transporting methylmalonyl-CoA/oxaloacetate decarboxylase gamma subunit
MAKRRESGEGEVSLFPFLSILACLIGALVLMIVVLVIAQVGKAEGRSPEEIRRAQDYLQIKKDIVERKDLEVVLKEKIATLEALQKQIDEKEQQFIKLRKLLTTSKDIQEANLKISQQMQKELDDLLTEIFGLKEQQKESQAEITKLMAELKKRQVPADKKIPPVVVQPSGSGMPEDTKAYFVEAGGGALKILGAWGEDYRLSAASEVVVADVAYNHFLTELAKNPKSFILFLVRDDGAGAFNNGAGRAEADYKIRVGKLPVPGRGVLDLALFDKYRGKIPPPPGAAAPAPAPGKPKAPAK